MPTQALAARMREAAIDQDSDAVLERRAVRRWAFLLVAVARGHGGGRYGHAMDK